MRKRSESSEEYLEALFKLSRGAVSVTVGRLAAALDVAPSSVSEMTGRLASAGLVTRDEGGGIALTDDGRKEGATLVRRHRLSERFLVDLLSLPWDRAHDEACRMEHALSPEVEARLAAHLGNPDTCPHGHAIPTEEGELADVPTLLLAELGPGESATVACVDETEPELLRYLANLGLTPDTRISVDSVAPFGGPQLVRVGEAQYALGSEVAKRIRVRADSG